MANQILNDTINNYFKNIPDSTIIKTHVFNILTKFPLENIKCLQIEDNTLNGIDVEKNSWRIHLVNLKTEEDIFIEVFITKTNTYNSRCYTIDDKDNIHTF